MPLPPAPVILAMSHVFEDHETHASQVKLREENIMKEREAALAAIPKPVELICYTLACGVIAAVILYSFWALTNSRGM